MTIKAILTGVTGMVGEGVLLECLQNPAVAEVLVLGRRPCGYTHAKLREFIVGDLGDLSTFESQLVGYNACFFCAGVSAIGLSPEAYVRITHDLTLRFAQTLARLNPEMTFCYVSGAGTDSSEQGRQRWARVKGRTENDLLKLPFRAAYMFRPGLIRPFPDQRNTLKMYRYLSWLYPVLRRLAPGSVGTMQELAQAMIRAAASGFIKPVLEVRDLRALAGQ